MAAVKRRGVAVLTEVNEEGRGEGRGELENVDQKPTVLERELRGVLKERPEALGSKSDSALMRCSQAPRNEKRAVTRMLQD
jgi:hypothetical protein